MQKSKTSLIPMHKHKFQMQFLMIFFVLLISVVNFNSITNFSSSGNENPSPDEDPTQKPISAILHNRVSLSYEFGWPYLNPKSGTGTEIDPYIIQDYVINFEGGYHGINIENTEKFFKIINCTIKNLDTTATTTACGIRLFNVRGVELINNTIIHFGYGISLEHVQNVTMIGNNITQGRAYGIYMRNVANALINNNSITNNEYYYKINYYAIGTSELAGSMNKNISISENFMDGLTGHAINIFNTERISILNNYLNDELEYSTHGIMFKNTSSIEMENNYFDYTHINFATTTNVQIMANEMDKSSITLANTTWANITNNYFLSSSFRVSSYPASQYIQLSDNIFENSHSAISIRKLSHGLIKNNWINSSLSGEFQLDLIDGSENCTVIGNTLLNSDGHSMQVSGTNLSIISNWIERPWADGMWLGGYNNLICDNTIIGAARGIYCLSDNTYYENNSILYSEQVGIQVMSNADNNTFYKNRIEHTNSPYIEQGTAINVYYSNNNNFTANTVYNYTDYGIVNEYWSKNTTIAQNNITYSTGTLGTGIYIKDSNGTVITQNKVFDNTLFGIQLENAYQNKIYKNIFKDNGWIDGNSTQRDPNTTEAWWNYWGDYLVRYSDTQTDGIYDTPYELNSSGFFDHYPLADEPLLPMEDPGAVVINAPIISSPSDISYVYGTDNNTIIWVVIDTSTGSPTYNISLNGAPPFVPNTSWISGQEITLNIDDLPIGSHFFVISVDDGLGNVAYDTVDVSVMNQNPMLTTPPDQTFQVGTTGTIMEWVITDGLVGGSPTYTVQVDGSDLAGHINQPWTSGAPITVDISTSTLGTDMYTITAADGMGGMAMDTAVITIVANDNPILSSPADQVVMWNNESSAIEWEVFDPVSSSPSYTVIRNGIGYDGGTWTSGGTINVPIYGTAVGNHTFQIIVNDGSGGTATDTAYVIVNDNPQVMDESNHSMREGTIGDWFYWNVDDNFLDEANCTYEIFRNGISVQNGTWELFTYIYVINDGLAPGSYTYNFTVSDGYGGVGWDIAGLTVTSNDLPQLNSPDVDPYMQGSDMGSIFWTAEDTYHNITSYIIFCNSSQYKTGYWAPTIPIEIRLDALMVGYYNFTIILDDGFGGQDSDSVIVTIIPNPMPAINEPPDISYIFGEGAQSITWIISDLDAPIRVYQIFRNDVPIGGGTWETETPIIISVNGLAIGTYYYEIRVFDGVNAEVIDNVMVTVNSTAQQPPDEEETPLPPKDEGSQNDNDNNEANEDSKIDGYHMYLFAAIGLITIAVIKKINTYDSSA